MRWFNFAVRADFSWPNRVVEIPFEGKSIVLQPQTEELSCTASLYDEAGTTFEIGGTTLSRFLSLRLATPMSAVTTPTTFVLRFVHSQPKSNPCSQGPRNYERIE